MAKIEVFSFWTCLYIRSFGEFRKSTAYTSRIRFAAASIRSVPEFWALFHFIRASARKKIDVL